MSDYGQSVLDTTDTLTGTWEYRGDEYDLKVEDISGADYSRMRQYAELLMEMDALGDDADDSDAERLREKVESIEPFSWEADDNQQDYATTLIQEKLIKPECDPETTGNAKVQALLVGMMETWQEAGDVSQAKEEMPLDKGNR